MVKPEAFKKVSPGMDKQGEWDKKIEAPKKATSLDVEQKRDEFKKKKAQFEEKKSREKEKKDAPDTFERDAAGGILPPSHDPLKKIETDKVTQEQEKAEKEAIKALKEKHEAEMREVLENVDISTLDTQNKAAVHTASLAERITDEKVAGLPQKTKEEALKGISWPDGKDIDVSKPLSAEQAEIVRLHAASTYIKALSNFSAAELKDVKKLAEIEKVHPGITDFINSQPVELLSQRTFLEAAGKDRKLLKGFVDSVEKNGMLVTGIAPTSKLGKTLVKVIQENVSEYEGINKSQEGLIDVEHFKWLKDALGASYMDLLFSRDFILWEEHALKKNRDVVLAWFHDAVAEKKIPDPKTATPEEMEAYRKTLKDEFGKATGVEGGKVETAIKHISRSQLSPFFRFLADIFAPFGAMFPGKAGDFWREYLANKDKGGGTEKYGEGRSTPFEGKWVENASASAIHAAAKSYLGKNESNSPGDIRAMHKSAGLNAGTDTPWCMSFVQHVLRHDMWFNSEQIGPPTASAAEWHKIGKHTDTPKPWDLVLIYRTGGSGRHIGFVDSISPNGSVNVLGGNQSDSVRVSNYSRSSVAEFRTLENTANTLAQGNGGESGHEGGQDALPESKGTVDKVVSYEQSLRLMADPSTPKYDEQWRLIIYKVDPNAYKRSPEMQAIYNESIRRGDKDKHFIAVHGTAADFWVKGGLDDNTLDKSWFHTMLNKGLYPYFISKKGLVFSTTENDANHPACVNDKANTITGYERLNNKGIAIEMSLRTDGSGSVEKPNDRQMQSGRDLILALRGKYNIGAGNVITSKDPVRDPVTWEFKGEHSDDFDDSVRAAMGIARYADTARRFREKKFFTDDLAINPKKEYVSTRGGDVQVKDASVYHEAEDQWGGKTALGNDLHYSDDPEVPTSCATNWGKFPPGTILRVNGKKYIVEDYGSFVNDHPDRIDRFVPKSKYKAELALKPNVEVLKWGDFALAARILRTRRPQSNSHIAMMLKQAEGKMTT